MDLILLVTILENFTLISINNKMDISNREFYEAF